MMRREGLKGDNVMISKINEDVNVHKPNCKITNVATAVNGNIVQHKMHRNVDFTIFFKYESVQLSAEICSMHAHNPLKHVVI